MLEYAGPYAHQELGSTWSIIVNGHRIVEGLTYAEAVGYLIKWRHIK